MAAKQPSPPPATDELEQFPAPHLAVDVAVMTVAPDADGALQPAVLLHRRHDGLAAGEWALPGRMVRDRERVAEAVRRALADKCGIDDVHPELLFVLDEPTRDSRGWVVSLAHMTTQPYATLLALIDERDDLAVAPIRQGRVDLPDGQDVLPFEHDLIVTAALEHLRAQYEEQPDPGGLKTGTFTIRELREVHEAILGRPLPKDTFRRHVEPHLRPTGRMSSGDVGKPAQLYRHQDKRVRRHGKGGRS